MRLPILLSALLCLLWVPTIQSAEPDTSAAEAKLKELAARQRQIFADAEKENADEDGLRTKLQQLCHEYDELLEKAPNFAPAYVAYALVLDKVDMRKEAARLLLRANQLDKEIPLVKNQLGNYLAEEGRPLDALNYYLAAIQLEPKEPLYHFQLGTLMAEAGGDFVKSGEWTRETVDKTMHDAFEQAMLLAPGDWRYAYRYGLSFYDLALPEWEEALQFWRAFETKVQPGIERQTCQLHQARVLIELRRPDEARTLLDAVTEPVLAAQREKLAARLAPAAPAGASSAPAAEPAK